MKTFEITQYEVHTCRYRVAAASQAEAVQKLFADEARLIADSMEMGGSDDLRGMPVAGKFADELEALDIELDDGCLMTVAEIEELPFALPPNIDIHPRDLQYFDTVVSFAREHDIERKLLEPLERLAGHTDAIVELGKDFAPQSFRFAVYYVEKATGVRKFRYNGGLIFYAGAESGAGLPQLSVTTSGRKDARWEIHT